MKGPAFYKFLLVALPAGLGISVVVALWWKIKAEDQRGMASLSYAASDFSAAGLRDAVGKLEDLIGPRGYDGELEQRRLRQAAALIQGELGLNNLGYTVKDGEAVIAGERIWKDYWVQSGEGSEEEALLIWANYRTDSASSAALISLAEWLRGRSFSRPVIVAFAVDGRPKAIPSEQAIEVTALGQGSSGLTYDRSRNELAPVAAKGEVDDNWKETLDWDDYLQQVRDLCDRVSELAGA
ncbi:MAG: hypothetical protein Q7Q71_06245 [Verrucomicrobiota bacterium JB023]|nr:hypothetical protein [Verrucomicrobiota bacterium JB023]